MSQEKPKPQPVSLTLLYIALDDILGALKGQRGSREIALAITKLQECLFWLKEDGNGGKHS